MILFEVLRFDSLFYCISGKDKIDIQMTDTKFIGCFFQVAHNFLYMYLCYFIFNTFKIQNVHENSMLQTKMILDSPDNKSRNYQEMSNG